jgi:putative oxidoreductase
MTKLEEYVEHAYALLRIAAGFMFAFHGVQKIFGILTEMQPALFSQIWFGGIIELLGGLAILVGFRTRLAGFICSGEMAVAYFQFHWKFQMDRNFFPALNKGEMAVLYCFVFLFIACRGGGIWSIDHLLMKPVKPSPFSRD